LDTDILEGLDSRKIVLSDFQTNPILETVLPSTNAAEMIIMVSISDSLGGVTNITQVV